MTENSEKTVILIRHGKTSYNALGKYMGCGIDEDLSVEGREEIAKNRDRIRKVCEGAIVYSGPLLRARHTAEILFDDKNVNIEDSLIEIDFGDFEGKSAAELSGDPRYQQWIDSDGTLQFPNGESIENFRARTMVSLHNIINKAADEDKIAIVCHGGNIMAIMSMLFGGKYFDYLIPNVEGYILKLAVEDGNIRGISYERY